MNNEELAIKIQQGNTGLIPHLWEQVYKFIVFQAGKFLSEYPEYFQQQKDDMINQSYMHFLTAIEKYDPEKGKFTSFLNWHLRNAFTEAIYCGRSKRLKNEPINTAISYDLPVDEAEGLTIMDMLVDDTAEAYYRHIEDIDFWKDVNELLQKAASNITDPIGREMIFCMLASGCTVNEAAGTCKNGIDIYHRYNTALQQMKKYIKSYRLKEIRKAIGIDEYVRGWGLSAWKENIFTSSTEYFALKNIEKNSSKNDILSVVNR